MNVALLGCGLIGGSIGLALKRNDPAVRVATYDKDGARAARAVERGAADLAAPSPADAARDADFVFIATPVRAIAEVARAVGPTLRPGTVLTDVGSTKSRVVLEVEGRLAQGVEFIGGHPMAGSEEEGIEAARADLFDGAWWILTPTERSDTEAYQRLRALLTTLGARVTALGPEEHDELMAVVSHVPQLTATALMNLASERARDHHAGFLALAAGGFRDVTRVAASNPEIWLDVCRENAEAISRALERFADRLLALRDLVERGDEPALGHELLSARDARRGLPGKEVAGDLFEVRMPVPDRPGILAQVTETVGSLGINIEDLQITHSSEGGKGVLRLTILGSDAASRVATALVERGYEATRVVEV